MVPSKLYYIYNVCIYIYCLYIYIYIYIYYVYIYIYFILYVYIYIHIVYTYIIDRLRRVPPATTERAILHAVNSTCTGLGRK